MCEHCNHNHKEHKNNEKIKLTRIILTIILFLFSTFLIQNPLLKISLNLCAYLIIGYDIIKEAIENLFKKELFDENFLMTIATLGALLIGEQKEAIMVMLLFQIGEMLENRAVEKSKDSIKNLINLKPSKANILKNGEIIETAPEKVNIDDIIVVKSGEKVPLDGIVVKNSANIDTSFLSGESLPVFVQENDEILSGSIVLDGTLNIKATKTFKNSTTSKILELIEDSADKKSKSENFITKFAKIYTPSVVALAMVLAFVVPIFNDFNFLVWFKRALTFLVISCPCALVISIPLTFFAGIGLASNKGILIKGSNFIEKLAKVKDVVFDKTGTLTKGKFKVEKIINLNDKNEAEILKIAASIENFSNHPLAKAITKEYKNDLYKASNIKEIAGFGLIGKVNDDNILVGNKKLMDKNEVKIEAISEIGSIIYVAKNKILIGYIVLNDEIKEKSKETIDEFKNLKAKTTVLSGDSRQIVEKVCKELNIDSYFSNLLPQNKVEKIESIINSSTSTIFVGDGINDAPVLKRADIGVSMGQLGSQYAIEASDIVIMDDNPHKIVTAIKIAKSTIKLVKENIIFILSTKILFLILGTFGLISLWGAVFADVGVTLIAILNSLRILKRKI